MWLFCGDSEELILKLLNCFCIGAECQRVKAGRSVRRSDPRFVLISSRWGCDFETPVRIRHEMSVLHAVSVVPET